MDPLRSFSSYNLLNVAKGRRKVFRSSRYLDFVSSELSNLNFLHTFPLLRRTVRTSLLNHGGEFLGPYGVVREMCGVIPFMYKLLNTFEAITIERFDSID